MRRGGGGSNVASVPEAPQEEAGDTRARGARSNIPTGRDHRQTERPILRTSTRYNITDLSATIESLGEILYDIGCRLADEDRRTCKAQKERTMVWSFESAQK